MKITSTLNLRNQLKYKIVPGEGCGPGGVTEEPEVLVTSSQSSEQDDEDAGERREEHHRHHLRPHLLWFPLPQGGFS